MNAEKPMLSDEQLVQLNLDIDLRLASLWQTACEKGDDEWTWDQVAAFIRAAYGHGYFDALTESTRGQLCIDNGCGVPERKGARS